MIDFTPPRKLSEAARRELDSLLRSLIERDPNALCALVVEFSGEILVQHSKTDLDHQSIAKEALALFISTEQDASRMLMSEPYQVMLQSSMGMVVLAACGGGILVYLTDSRELTNSPWRHKQL